MIAAMNRLKLLWEQCWHWVKAWFVAARAAQESGKLVRALRRELRQQRAVRDDLHETMTSRDNEVLEYRADVQRLEHELDQATNQLELAKAALEYEVQWREREMERMRCEAAIYVRRRLEAVSGETGDVLGD